MDSKLCRFNTVSGKHCYYITFVFPSLRSGTRDVRTSSSLHSSAASHPSSHTASGRHCCNILYRIFMTEYFSVSIPQAVGTVATIILYLLDEFRNSVSIPQAVSTVATHISYSREGSRIVSIPQAVSTVATTTICYKFFYCSVSIPQAVSTVATR